MDLYGNNSGSTILLYINSIHDGGAERVILQLAHHFSQADYRTVLVTSFIDEGKEYPVPDGVTRLSMEHEEIRQSRLMRNVTRIRKLRTIIKQEKPKAVIAFMTEPIFRVAVATIGLPTKKIFSIRNDPAILHSKGIGLFVGKYIIPRADGVVFQTEDAKAWFPQSVQKKSTVIFNEVSSFFFSVQRAENSKSIVTFGRLANQKNHKMLIDAFAQIAGKYPEEELLIYGRGELRDVLQAQINALGLTDRVKLMGATDQVPQILAQSKVFVLSSDYEGMPNALMEAMAVGVPCISTDCPCGGPRTLIEDGTNGLLVPVGDTQAMARAIDRLLGDGAYAKQLGDAARISAKQFEPDKVFEQWKGFVEQRIV